MIQASVKGSKGETLREIELDERVFGIEPNVAVLHQAVVAQLSNQRKGTHSTKTRGQVAGGGRKPWRQKGTGRARQGSTRAPHWRHGGIVFGPHPRSYHKDMPRKMRRLAMRSALSAKLRDGEMMIVDALALPQPKTREMKAALASLGATGSALLVLGQADEAIKRASANLPKVRAVAPGSTNLLDVLNHHWLLLTVEAVEALTAALTADLKPAEGASANGDAKTASASTPSAGVSSASASTASADTGQPAASAGSEAASASTASADASKAVAGEAKAEAEAKPASAEAESKSDTATAPSEEPDNA